MCCDCLRLDGAIHTLVHEDFSPRNLCFRKQGPQDSGSKVILDDWGDASADVPQFDLSFFINYLVDPESELDRANALIDFYLDCLPEQIRATVKNEDFIEIYDLSVLRYLVTRQLSAISVADEANVARMFRSLRNNLRWVEHLADNYL